VSRKLKISTDILTFFALLVMAAFAIWWFLPQHIPNNFAGNLRILDVLLFTLVSFVVWHPIVMQVFSWAVASNIKPAPSVRPKHGAKVAFITNFVPSSESVDLLHKTLPAMVKAAYKHDTWLLDEGNSREVRAICKKYGVLHFSRKDIDHYNTEDGKFARRTKGGNHNSWYDKHGHAYDYVAQIDTDFTPSKNFLTKTLGYFKDPKVAFVGTPQIYGNINESLIARGAAEQTYNFYGHILRGFYGMDSTMLIGANHVIRVKALEDVDHYSAHITEDLLTGMKLHANGWKSVYVPEALAVGEGPTTWRALFSQQKRWAFGCMHVLLHHSFKLFRTMTLRQKVYYFFLQQHYFSGLAMGVGIVGLVTYFTFGLTTADIEFSVFLSLYLPALAVCGLMALWLQRYNVRPDEEKGWLWAGKVVGIAVWPIFLVAFFEVLSNKRLGYKVTPKGLHKAVSDIERSVSLFKVHIAIGLVCLACFLSSFYTGRTSAIMLFWAAVSAALLLTVPFINYLIVLWVDTYNGMYRTARTINNHLRLFEVSSPAKNLLPEAPTDAEKHLYVKRNYNLLMVFSIISFTCVTVSMTRFLFANPLLWSLFGFLILTVAYFVISFIVNVPTKGFDFKAHKALVAAWRPRKYPTVDIFLPTAGEPIDVLANTWDGVAEVREHYKGKVAVYCLDDSLRNNVKTLAKKYKFIYKSRPNRGEFKKAGNLRFGFGISSGQFIAIFDADFRPRHDFLNELMPYMQKNKKLGIVQSPQYFDVHTGQNWLERGAGAVQELFYRFSQVSRQNHGAAICVGSNALYRRKALDSTGGTALIEHSEDVHTGFNLRMNGWMLQYVPVLLAKGLCPENMTAFFKQQYRWCMGSMSLLGSRKFWDTKLPIRTRLSYVSGFLYYIHTAVTSFFAPLIPLSLLMFMPEKILPQYVLLILPAFIYTQVIYPLWHKSIYGTEAWAIRMVYGWAHLFAISDSISKRRMQWQPTGAVKGRDYRYLTFRFLQFTFNFIPAILWVGFAAYYVFTVSALTYGLVLASGVFYLAISAKIALYTTRPLKFIGSLRIFQRNQQQTYS
jgi:cellulose synthase (UDP-forming)